MKIRILSEEQYMRRANRRMAWTAMLCYIGLGLLAVAVAGLAAFAVILTMQVW